VFGWPRQSLRALAGAAGAYVPPEAAADVRTSLLNPSAQDYYLGERRASDPGGLATDAERGILAGVAGGLQPAPAGATRPRPGAARAAAERLRHLQQGVGVIVVEVLDGARGALADRIVWLHVRAP
jgi:hypothetical protein